MKFRIKHQSRAFLNGIIVPWIVSIAALLLFVFLGLDITDELETMILIGVFTLCAAVELIFLLLFIAEKIYGAKVVVEVGYIDVKKVLRRKRLYFDKINEAKYRHYYDGEKDRRGLLAVMFAPQDRHYDKIPLVRSQLSFYLTSGKVFTINDKATGYSEKRKKWLTEPDLDPDKDVTLYKVYQCYLSANRQFYNTMEGTQL